MEPITGIIRKGLVVVVSMGAVTRPTPRLNKKFEPTAQHDLGMLTALWEQVYDECASLPVH